jgi:hypothetical protein
MLSFLARHSLYIWRRLLRCCSAFSSKSSKVIDSIRWYSAFLRLRTSLCCGGVPASRPSMTLPLGSLMSGRIVLA